MAKVHDKFVIELAEVIKGYGNDPDVDDPFHLSEFYRFYELPEIAVSTNNFKAMIPLADVQPVVHWIPCSERLPEKYGNYLVTTDDGEVDIGSCDPENKGRQDHFWSGCDADGFFWYGENIVLAWMPLPEPYKGDDHAD